MSVFELVMLICFGISWPFNVAKSYQARTAKGKSLVFLLAIIVGYLCGILHKILYSCDAVLAVYVVNLVMVTADLILYFRNRNLDRRRALTDGARQP